MELDELRMGLNNRKDKLAILQRYVIRMNMKHAPFEKCFIKVPHPCGNLLFAQKLNFMNGIGKNVCMEIV